jgi:hypothetical protein
MLKAKEEDMEEDIDEGEDPNLDSDPGEGYYRLTKSEEEAAEGIF